MQAIPDLGSSSEFPSAASAFQTAFTANGDFSTSALHFTDGDTRRLIPLKQLLPGSFFNSYRHEHKFGGKLSYTIIMNG